MSAAPCNICGLLPGYVTPKGVVYRKCIECFRKANKEWRDNNREAWLESAKKCKEKTRRARGAKLMTDIKAAKIEKQKAAQIRRENRKHDAHVRRYKFVITEHWQYMSDERRKEHTAKLKGIRNRNRLQASESYARKLLAKNTRLKASDIPHELVLLKQAQLKIKNHLNQNHQGISK